MAQTIDPEKLYGDKELAAHLGVGIKSLARILHAGLIPFAMVGKRKVIRGQAALDYLKQSEAVSAAKLITTSAATPRSK